MDGRKLSILVQSLVSAWMLSFLIEGQVLYTLAAHYKIDPAMMIFGNLIANYVGLLVCGLVIKSKTAAKRLYHFSFLFFIIISVCFFFPLIKLWTFLIVLASFLAGACVAAWGFFLKENTLKDERIKSVADLLIISNILMTILNVTAVYISAHAALAGGVVLLLLAFWLSFYLPDGEKELQLSVGDRTQEKISIRRLLYFLCFFILFITISSGLMYQVVRPAFTNLDWLTSWYWAVPYIISIFIMRNLPQKRNRTYILFVAISMIAMSFVGFMVLGRDAISYLIVNTLMLGACGVFDLFWWSIIGEMLELRNNPATVFGIGLSANVLGVIVGGLLGKLFVSGKLNSPHPALMALFLLSITLIMLPPLHRHLVGLLKNHAYLTTFLELTKEEKAIEVDRTATYGQLSDRESQVVSLLLEGKTNKVIASDLFISENTVKYFIKSIYSKFNVHNRTELITLLYEQKEKNGD